LIRLLLHHPFVSLQYVQSTSQAGVSVSKVHTDLIGNTDLVFRGDIDPDIDVVYLAMGHGESQKFLRKFKFSPDTKIIDMSQDHRVDTDYIYGLSECNRDKIYKSFHVANPGCFATAILLGLIPLATVNLLKNDINISAITGSTGAGKSLSATSHFSWRHSNISVYKPFAHQHLTEISATLKNISNTELPAVNFIPFRGNFTRGILAIMYTRTEKSDKELQQIFQNYYSESPFIILTDQNPDIKQVVNTNKCILHIEKHNDVCLIISIIDNLIKGAAGQAIQNMNLMFDLDETAGLQLKASYF